MSNFERKSMEEILQRMVHWTQGVTQKITDFRVGSRARTLYESVALVVEGLYDKVFRHTRVLIEENIYTVMGFPKRPAVHSTGRVTFGRVTPADSNYLIPAGTLIVTRATQNRAPLEFRTTADVLLPQGETTVQAPVICLTAGVIGNIEAQTITDFVTKPSGVDTVINTNAFDTGLNEETKDEQKIRFRRYISSLSRGTLLAIEYGATLAQITDGDGLIVQRVHAARAFEYLPERKGEVDVYVWDGVGTATPELLEQTKRVVNGYYDPISGEPVYGYKSAGTLVSYYSALANDVTLKLVLTPEEGVPIEDIQVYVEREVDEFFSSLNLGQTLVQTALETRIKLIAGVYDIKVWLSTDDGATYTQENLTTDSGTEIFVVKKPLIYE